MQWPMQLIYLHCMDGFLVDQAEYNEFTTNTPKSRKYNAHHCTQAKYIVYHMTEEWMPSSNITLQLIGK